MKKLILLTLLLISSGCATARIETTRADGKLTGCTASYTSLFLNVDTINASACGGKGDSTGSKVNTELIGQLLKMLLVAP